MTHRKKKPIVYHFVDMNDPDRYKKLKVARACDFCRRRKSKCDIGIPGSGTCSNCKKANHVCIFSPTGTPHTTTTTTTSNSTTLSVVPASSTATAAPMTYSQTKLINTNFMDRYEAKFPFFSINQKGYCGYERDNIYSHVTLSPTTTINLPVYSKQFEHDLFQVYFGHIHPFFPILDKYNILQSLLYDTIPSSLRWAVMAIVTSHFSHINRQDSNEYYQHAINQLDHTPSLLTVQTLLLLYKHQELNTPVGVPITQSSINYLNQAQSILSQWNSQDEYVCRAKWILFIILSFSNIADKRLKNTLNYYSTPNSLPSLTETEQYDEIEISTTCNLIHLCNIALIYSQTISLISETNTLFNITIDSTTSEFIKLSNGLNVWKSTLPQHIAHFINKEDPSYHQQNNSFSKSSSYIIYLCLIHDILDLLITSNQPNQFHTLSKKALSVCFRAHQFTLGDMQPNQFSRLASIQGSRMVSFGLTLSVQAQSFYDHLDEENDNNSICSSSSSNISNNNNDNDKIVIEKSSCFSIAYPILEQITLSPQLYMTIHTFHAQLESKKQLEQHQQKHPGLVGVHGRLDSNSSRGTTSTNSTMDGSYFYNTPNTSNSIQQQQQQKQQQQVNDSSNEWHHYTSYTSSNHHHHQQQQQQQQQFQSNWADQPIYQQQEDIYKMPATPNFEERNDHLNSPDMNNSPSSLTATESYFDIHQPSTNNFGPSVMVLSGPYDFISHHPIERAYNSKCSDNKN